MLCQCDSPNLSIFQTDVTKLMTFEEIHTFRASEYRGADKSLAQPGRKQATATEDFELHISYLKS
jgi:hypothetical protein